MWGGGELGVVYTSFTGVNPLLLAFAMIRNIYMLLADCDYIYFTAISSIYLRRNTCAPNNALYKQGPVVQSIVSLTSSLRGQIVMCFITLYLNI